MAILNSSDPDDETLQFDLKGELANDILSVTSLNHTEAVVRLSKQLDREVSTYSMQQPGCGARWGGVWGGVFNTTEASKHLM